MYFEQVLNILKKHRFSHCGLIMGEHQIKWAREKGFKIFYEIW